MQEFPFSVGKLAPLETVGHEATIRLEGKTIGLVQFNPEPVLICKSLHHRGFSNLDLARFRQYCESIGATPETFSLDLAKSFHQAKKFSKVRKKLLKILENDACVYRLKSWPSDHWDYIGVGNLEIGQRFLEVRFPDLEYVFNRETFPA